MRLLFSAFLLSLTLILASCASPPAQDYSYEPLKTPGARLCMGQCEEAKNYCHQGCDLDTRACARDVQVQGMKDYDDYTRRQFKDGLPIEFRPRDFERMTPCNDRKKECTNDCESHFASCYKTCGGSVDLKNACTLSFLCF